MDTGLQWKSIKGKGEIESCLAGRCLCQVRIITDYDDPYDDLHDNSHDHSHDNAHDNSHNDSHDNRQGEHADCRGRSLNEVPSSSEGRIIKSL